MNERGAFSFAPLSLFFFSPTWPPGHLLSNVAHRVTEDGAFGGNSCAQNWVA